MPNNPLYVSAEKLEELKAELQELETVRRHEIADRIERAKDLGDLSENADYHDAKDAMAANESRIATIKNDLTRAVIIKPPTKDQVSIGCFVKVSVDGKEREKPLKIVGAAEADPGSGFISNESPIGQALIGLKPGERAVIKTPAGEKEYHVIEIDC